MTETFDYRVIELKTTLLFDYIEEESFEEFYMEFKKVCDKHNVHMNCITRRADLLNCEINKNNENDGVDDMIYQRPVNPENKCRNCNHLTRIVASNTGKRYCSFVDAYVDEDSLCPEYER